MSGSQEGLSWGYEGLSRDYNCLTGVKPFVREVYKVCPVIMMKFCLGYLRSFPSGLSDISNVYVLIPDSNFTGILFISLVFSP